MAKLKDKVENALNEARMLVLGAQVLVGFQFRSVFEPGFDKLPLPSQLLKMVGLGLMLVATVILLPIVLLYTGWVYRVMRGRVSLAHVKAHPSHY